jgi:hypothetical protein
MSAIGFDISLWQARSILSMLLLIKRLIGCMYIYNLFVCSIDVIVSHPLYHPFHYNGSLFHFDFRSNSLADSIPFLPQAAKEKYIFFISSTFIYIYIEIYHTYIYHIYR